MRTPATAMALVLIASACGGGADSAELEALREEVASLMTTTVAPTTTLPPTTTVVPTTTLPPTTTVVPTTTLPPTTTVAPTTTTLSAAFLAERAVLTDAYQWGYSEKTETLQQLLGIADDGYYGEGTRIAHLAVLEDRQLGTSNVPTSPPTTTTTTTTPPPTTTMAPLTTADLLGALPTVLNLPMGWSSSGDSSSSLEPKTGEGLGNCGKGNAASRAIANNVAGYADSPGFLTTERGWASLRLYGFGTEEDAKGFVALSVSQANCPDGLEYELEEGENWEDGHVNMFHDEGWDGVVWTVFESISLGSAAGEDADEAFFTNLRTQYMTTLGSTAFGKVDSTVSVYERHGRLVMIHEISGTCCQYGWSNVQAQSDYTPTYSEVSASLEILRPHVLDALLDR